MARLTIVANIKANENKIDLVKAELLKLIDITRAEEGCMTCIRTMKTRHTSYSTKIGNHVIFGKRIWTISI